MTQHRRPDRHRIGDDDGAGCGAAQLCETRENLEAGDIEQSGNHDVDVLATGYLQVVAAEYRGGEQGRRTNAGPGNPEAPRRQFAQCERRRDPIQAPGESEQYDQ
jgi:hypothetical protein